ncbi:MAG: hypothetical protein ACLQEQ_06770 [Nitrososphaerales archaeon]
MEEFFDSVNAVIKSTPGILQDAVIGIAVVAIAQAFLSIWIPVWLVTICVAGYTVWSLLKEGLAVWKSRRFRVFAIALLTLLVDLYFTIVV